METSPTDNNKNKADSQKKIPNLWKSIRANVRYKHQSFPISLASRNVNLPLSFNQERLWFIEQLQSGTSIHSMSCSIKFDSAINVTALERSLREIIQRHEILRTAFQSVDNNPVQVISPAIEVNLKLIDLRALPEKKRQKEAKRIIAEDKKKPFDLTQAGLWRFQLLRLEEESYSLSARIHHIIFDAWSGRIFKKELLALYEAFSTGKPSPLRPLPIQYADFAQAQRAWLQGEVLENQLDYWRQKFSGKISPLKLPIDYPRTNATSDRGASQKLIFSPELTQNLKALTRQENISLFVTLLAAFQVLLYCYTGQTDLILSSPNANRNRVETKKLIGYFNSILALRTNLTGNPSFKQILSRVSQVVLEANNYQDFPLDKLSDLPNLANIPLWRCMFGLQNIPGKKLNQSTVHKASNVTKKSEKTVNFDLYLSMKEKDGQLKAGLKYKTDLFTATTITQMLENFQTLLETVVANPNICLEELPSLQQEFSIDTSKITKVLTQHSQIEDSIVLIQEDTQTEKQLVAYVIPSQKQVLKSDELRSCLKQQLPNYLVPSALILIEAIPLTPEGKVDNNALNTYYQIRQQSAQEYIAPRTSTEKKLAEIWTKILWLEQEIGIYDNFFALGGHSLLAVRLVTEIEKTFNQKLPLNLFAQLSTIAELAKLLDQEPAAISNFFPSLKHPALTNEIYHQLLAYTSGWPGTRVNPNSLVIGMNTKGTKQPLFWCLQGFRELSQLSKYLGAEQPTYGMRSAHLIAKYTPDNIRAIAAQYVSEILAIQPHGTYLLGGNCQSASIIFEISQQLQKQGKTITLLCLMERFIPEVYSGRVALFFGRGSRFNPYKKFRNPQLGYRKFYTGEFSLNIFPGEHGRFFSEPNIQILADKLNTEIDKAQSASVANKLSQEKYQILPLAAYQAKIVPKKSLDLLEVTTEEPLIVSFSVTNISSITWKATDSSGIRLGNHWLDSNGKVICWFDGIANLYQDILPGATASLKLKAIPPQKPGSYQLELDLLEEGVTWFKDKGSETTIIEVEVKSPNRESLMEVAEHGFPLIKSRSRKLRFPYPQLENLGPNFIGATGGSGTRVVAKIVKQGGLFLGNNCNESEDSLDILGGFSTGRMIAHWQKPMPTELYAQMVQKLENGLTKLLAGLHSTQMLQSWGWKVPPSIFSIPFLHSQFPQMKCLHLIRDGRDMAYSNNQNQLRYLGPVVLNVEELYLSNPLQSIALWSKLNLLTAEYGEKYLPDQYLRIRFEDLCLQPIPTIERIFKFFGLTDDIEQIAQTEVAPPNSLGRWQAQDPEILAKLHQIGKVALEKFGYVEQSPQLNDRKSQTKILESKNSGFYLQKGHFYYERGDMVNAIANYQKAIQLNSHQPVELYQNLGIALTNQDKFTEAIAAYQKALELEPDNADIYFLLATIQTKQKNLVEAATNYYKAIELEPKNSWFYKDLGLVLTCLDRLEESIEIYTKAITLDRDNSSFYKYLGSAQIRTGHPEIGVQSYEKAKELNPEQSEVCETRMSQDYRILGNNYHQQDNPEAAILAYRCCLELKPNQYGVYLSLGKNLHKLNQIAEAIAIYRQAIALVPENPSAYQALGQAQLNSGDIPGAISSYEKAIVLDSKPSFAIYKKLGNILRTAGDIEGAIAAYTKALELDPDNKIVWQSLAKLNQQQQRKNNI